MIEAELTTGSIRRLAATTLEIRAGAVTAVLGRNGSGKSSLMALLSGDEDPTAGHIEVAGRDLATMSGRERAQARALLAQDRQVTFSFTVEDVVTWGRTPWRGARAAREDRAVVEAALTEQGLLELRNRSVTSLSGGERTRVHLARVIAQQAPLLLLDEADADLDVAGRHDLDAWARRHAEAGGSVVVVTHDLLRARHAADDAVLLRRGEVIAHGPVTQVLTSSALEDAFGVPITGW
jgi:iron complex transport system ATP-binding protein